MIIRGFVCVCFYCPPFYYISLRSLIFILSVIIDEEVVFHFNSLICSHLFLFTSFVVSHCFGFAVVVVETFLGFILTLCEQEASFSFFDKCGVEMLT